jgi:hypothetical protein
MQEVLVNGGELRFKRLAQILQNFIVSAHSRILAAGVSPFNSGWGAAICPRHGAEEIRLAVASVWNHSVVYVVSPTSELV